MNLFDTAEVYGLGRSEYLCGKFRRDYKGVDKSGIVIGEQVNRGVRYARADGLDA